MTQGRKAAPAASSNSPVMDRDSLAAAGHAITELAQRSAEIAQRFDDGLPYDRNRMVSEARFYMGQSAEAMLEAGKRLIVLKENEQHGEFLSILEDKLGLNARTAQRMMAAAVKYLSPALAANATTLSHLGKAKMLELITEDDADLADLARGGTLAGKTLDELQAMSCREMRAAMLESNKDKEAKNKVIKKQYETIARMQEAEERRLSGSPNEREQAQLDDLRTTGLAAEMAVRKLLAAAGRTVEAPATEAAGTAAQQAVEFVAQVLAGLISDAGIQVNFAEMVTPHWLTGTTPPTNKQ